MALKLCLKLTRLFSGLLRPWIRLVEVFSKMPWHFISLEIVSLTGGLDRNLEAIKCSRGWYNLIQRKDGRDEMVHSYRVAQIIIYYTIVKFPCIIRKQVGMRVLEAVIMAGLLHDIPENIHLKILREIRNSFGAYTSFLVWLLTKKENEPIDTYFSVIETDMWAVIIKLADRLHNLRNMTNNLESAEFFSVKRLHEQIVETQEMLLPVVEKILNHASGHGPIVFNYKPIVSAMHKDLLHALANAKNTLIARG